MLVFFGESSRFDCSEAAGRILYGVKSSRWAADAGRRSLDGHFETSVVPNRWQESCHSPDRSTVMNFSLCCENCLLHEN